MEMVEFFGKYPDEASCRRFFKQRREREHEVCKQCGSLRIYWREKESRWRCKDCKHPMGLKAGTVMENSNLGYKPWLWCLYLMALTKKGFSALEMKRMLGHNRYEPVWLMMQKVRISMGHRDDTHKLDGFLEMDEGFFEGHRKKEADGSPAKELDRQVKAIVAVSSTAVPEEDQEKGKPKTRPGFVKMSVVSSLCNMETTCTAQKMIQKAAKVMTDGRRCYQGLKDICAAHEAVVVQDKTQVAKLFPWVHTAISNAKKKLLGLHHQVKDCYMQNYLSEFCYKFNRRHFGQGLFERPLVATMETPWYRSKPNNG